MAKSPLNTDLGLAFAARLEDDVFQYEWIARRDGRMPHRRGLAVRAIQERAATLRVALEAGDLLAALVCAFDSGYAYNDLIRSLPQQVRGKSRNSVDKRSVERYLRSGLSQKVIAHQLKCNIRTVSRKAKELGLQKRTRRKF
jgi:hypothetical protein